MIEKMNSNATIYIADPSLIGSKLFDQFSEIKKVTPLSEGKSATGLAMDLDYASIQMNFIPIVNESWVKGFE